jgi:hypothetical protein
MNSMALRRAGWLSSLIERARANGVDDHDIAAALEGSIAFRPMTIARDERERLVGTIADAEVTVSDLFSHPPKNRRAR